MAHFAKKRAHCPLFKGVQNSNAKCKKVQGKVAVERGKEAQSKRKVKVKKGKQQQYKLLPEKSGKSLCCTAILLCCCTATVEQKKKLKTFQKC